MIPPGMETATFRLVSQCRNELRYRVPQLLQGLLLKIEISAHRKNLMWIVVQQ